MTDKKLRSIVRIANTDLDGNKAVYHAMRKIPGLSYMFSNAVCNIAGVDNSKKAGELSDDELSKIEAIIKDPIGHGIPVWMVNRRKDINDGKDRHLLTTDLRLRREFDIKMMQKIKSYKGIRHAIGQPVRGQRTKAHFRVSGAVGVQRRAVKAAAAGEKKEGKEKK